MELIQRSIEGVLEKRGLSKEDSLEIRGLYVLAGKSGPVSKVEYMDHFDEVTFTAEHTPVTKRGICSFEVIYQEKVLGEASFIIPPENKVVSEYETAKVLLEQTVTELNQRGYHLSYDSSQKGYRQQLMENVESHPLGHLTLGPKGLSESTAKAVLDAIKGPPLTVEEFLKQIEKK
ncbi:MAG: hypothetical protein WCV90_03295 [Candidatus Woesearchaeota archaeon]|jgi:hypothetical protein